MTRCLFLTVALLSSTPLAAQQTTALVGDTGNSLTAKKVAAMIKAQNPTIISLLGDLGYGYTISVGRAVDLAGYGAVKGNIVASIGNHDYRGCAVASDCVKKRAGNPDQFTSYFGTGTYGHRRVGDVHYFFVNSDKRERDGIGVGSKQYNYIKAAMLASNAPHKVVQFHDQYISSQNSTRNLTGWAFESWGATLVAYGHIHQIEIFRLDENKDGKPIFYVQSGLGGHSCQPGTVWSPAGSQFRYCGNQGFGAVFAEHTQYETRVHVRTIQNAVLFKDSLPLPKVPAAPPPAEICSDGTPLPAGEEVCPEEGGTTPPPPVVEPPPPPPPVVVETLTKPIYMTAGQTIENRSFAYATGLGNGAIMFQIEPGDNNVAIRNVQTQGGYEVIRAGGGAISGITVDGLRATGVKRSCFWGRGTDVRTVVIRNISCLADPTFLPTSLGDLREGLALHTAYDGVLIENSRFSGFKMAMTGYNNGDGVASEREAKNVTLRRVVATDNSDGGFDVKTEGLIADDLYAARNFRNFRLWGDVKATRLSCGDFTGACIWANGRSGLDPLKPTQTIAIDLLVVRAGPSSKGPVLLGTNTVKPIFIIKACDIQGPAGMVIKQGISAKSVLGPGCNVVKPFTAPLVIPDVVGSPAVIGERG